MIKQKPKGRKNILLTVLTIFLISAGAGITFVWMNSGFVECSGYLEPDSWVPLFAEVDGLVMQGTLFDGMNVSEGDPLLFLDDEWPLWNLDRINLEQRSLDDEINAGEESLILFRTHREIEESELRRIIASDRMLLENASLTMNELEHDEYLYRAFSAGADREEAALKQAVSSSRREREALNVEKLLWDSRLRETRVSAPATGVFFSSETVLSGASKGLIPSVGPGRTIETGRLLGYIIPDRGIHAHIEIPQRHISSCHPGQRVLLSVAARPQWRYPPIYGRIESITGFASGGGFHAKVSLSLSARLLPELKSLSCGDLTARIDIREHRIIQLAAYEKWLLIVDSAGRR